MARAARLIEPGVDRRSPTADQGGKRTGLDLRHVAEDREKEQGRTGAAGKGSETRETSPGLINGRHRQSESVIRIGSPNRQSESAIQIGNPNRQSAIGNPNRQSKSAIQIGNPNRQSA